MQFEFAVQENDKQRKIKLKNGLGTMTLRTKPAIIRYHHFNVEKDPEDFSHVQLFLFIEWRNEIEDLLKCGSYSEHYRVKYDEIKAKRDTTR